MDIIRENNVNGALATALRRIAHSGVEQPSRVGPVLELPWPVMTEYTRPWQRVLFSPMRNANPFFHYMEAMWMLAGRNDLAFVHKFNKRFIEYSDDGTTLHGAYGHRWRTHFGRDQVLAVISELHDNPKSRRAVIGMWDPRVDSGRNGRDLPCNTTIYFDLRGDVLNMTVCCRSNDALWGAYGANAVHFSFLQQFIAECLGVGIGVYRQFSNNLHLYTDVLPRSAFSQMIYDVEAHDWYTEGRMHEPQLLMRSGAGMFMRRLHRFFDDPDAVNCLHEATGDIIPIYQAWKHRKTPVCRTWLEYIESDDWRLACTQWIERYHARRDALINKVKP